MGLFSKKTYMCDKCGIQFEKRLNLFGNLCDACWQKEEKERTELEKALKGYKNYANDVLYKTYSVDELKIVLNRRDNLLETVQNENTISREELSVAGKNYKSLTLDEATSVIVRAIRSSVSEQIGSAYAKDFFVLSNYENVVVDAKDVFAVSYTTAPHVQVNSSEVLLCAIFTNDPYVPVFPMVFVMKKGFFEFAKSKEGREYVKQLFEEHCPNLTYPIGELQDLKKTIKSNKCVNGQLDEKFVLEQIRDASNGIGIFEVGKMCSALSDETVNMLNRIGYIREAEVDALLKMDKSDGRNYWLQIIDTITTN